MTTWQISESSAILDLDGRGRATVTFTVTNPAIDQDRAVLTVTPLDGASEDWFEIEQPQQRAVAGGQSAVYPVVVTVPPGTAAATYAFQGVVYSADRDPSETSATSKRVTFEVAPAPKPPPAFRWWMLAIPLVIIAVIVGVFAFLRGGDAPSNNEPPEIAGTAAVLQVLTASEGDWDRASEFEFQWERCDATEDECEPIDVGVGPDYQVGNDDPGSRLRVRVTAVNDDGSTEAVSAPTGVVPPAAPATFPVPDTVGMSRQAALAALREHFQVLTVTSGPTAPDCNPTVSGQSPRSGQRTAGEPVAITHRPLAPLCNVITTVPERVLERHRIALPGFSG